MYIILPRDDDKTSCLRVSVYSCETYCTLSLTQLNSSNYASPLLYYFNIHVGVECN